MKATACTLAKGNVHTVPKRGRKPKEREKEEEPRNMEATWCALLTNLEEWMGKRPNMAASSHQKL